MNISVVLMALTRVVIGRDRRRSLLASTVSTYLLWTCGVVSNAIVLCARYVLGHEGLWMHWMVDWIAVLIEHFNLG